MRSISTHIDCASAQNLDHLLTVHGLDCVADRASVYRPLQCIYTGWCISSRTTAFPHMARQGDEPWYYLHVMLLIWNILTRTTEVMSMNKLGKICDVM